jgi:hypothetical protein
MTKVVFQVGLLGFFVSALFFGIQGMPLMDMVLRSFIVFIAAVLLQVVVFVVAASMKSPRKPATPRPENQRPPAQDAGSAQTTTPS